MRADRDSIIRIIFIAVMAVALCVLMVFYNDIGSGGAVDAAENDVAVPVVKTELQRAYEKRLSEQTVKTGLPIIWIETANKTPVSNREDEIGAYMITINGSAAQFDDESLYEGAVTIRGRGNSSWWMPKKSYSLTLGESSTLLNMPKDRDFVLSANYADKTLMRNYLAYKMASDMDMPGTPRVEFVELYLNGTHLGNYLLVEKIKITEKRLNIDEIKNVTGQISLEPDMVGYVFEIDTYEKYQDGDRPFETVKISRDHAVLVKRPSSKKMGLYESKYLSYAEYFVNKVEDALYGEDFLDPELGYARYIDVDAAIDWIIVQELFKNVDSRFHTSVFMYKPYNEEKLYLGPVWDFDLSLGNVDYSDSAYTYGNYITTSIWIERLFKDETFVKKYNDRLLYVLDEILPLTFERMDETERLLAKSAALNFSKWRILGSYVWPNPAGYESRNTYAKEVQFIREWLAARAQWMRNNLHF